MFWNVSQHQIFLRYPGCSMILQSHRTTEIPLPARFRKDLPAGLAERWCRGVSGRIVGKREVKLTKPGVAVEKVPFRLKMKQNPEIENV
jgi:hypothetical protein